MKVLIDIPEKAYNRISEKTEVLYSEMIIANGTPLDGLTNGEVFQKVFPNIPIEVGFNEKYGTVSFYHNGENNNRFNLDWWNRKWGE